MRLILYAASPREHVTTFLASEERLHFEDAESFWYVHTDSKCVAGIHRHTEFALSHSKTYSDNDSRMESRSDVLSLL